MRDPKYTPINKHPEAQVYHDYYDKYRIESPVINNDANKLGINQILWDRRSVAAEIAIRREEVLPALQIEFDKLYDQFDSISTQQKRKGRKPITEWPKELLEKKYRVEARYSVVEEEIGMLERKLEKYKLEDEAKELKKVLINGPKGSETMNNGRVSFIDGQRVSYTEDEDNPVAYIDCASSPFDGMSLQDYFKYIVEEWKIARINQQLLNERELDRRGISHADRPFGKRKGTNVPWPERPENITNHKIKENEEIN